MGDVSSPNCNRTFLLSLYPSGEREAHPLYLLLGDLGDKIRSQKIFYPWLRLGLVASPSAKYFQEEYFVFLKS